MVIVNDSDCRPDDATLTEHRLRLLSGIKRTLVARRMQGLLTVEGLRMLQYACDSSAHHADHPIQVWSVLERNVSGGWATWTVSKLAKASTGVYSYMPRFLKYMFAWPSTQWGNLLSGFLSRRMLEACEIAVEYYLALLNSPQVHWMRLHGDVYHHVLLEEVESESKAAHAFISDREKEVPDRFQAIQSYRSAMALLRRQLHYLSELFEIGIIDKGEHRMLVKPVDKKILRLEIAGPVWRPPKPREMLRSLKYMCALSEESFEKIWSAGVLRELGKGEHFWIASDRPSSLNSGVYFILSGGVTCIHVTSEGKRKEEFQGAGGLVGALLSLAGSRVPGKEWAVAEGNAVGRGPLVFFLPQSFISTQIVELYNSGDEEMEIFEDILLKEAAVYVVSCLEHEILQAVKTHVEDAVNTATLLQEGHDSMKKSNSRSFRNETKPSMASLRRRFSLNSGGQNTNLKKRTPSSLRKRSTSQVADTGYSGSQHQNLDAMMRHITDVVELRDDEVEVDLHYSSRAAGGEDDASFAKVTETTKRWSNGMDVPLNSPTDGGKGDATEPGQLAVEDGLPNHNVPKQRMVRFTSSYGKGRNSKNSLDIASALQGIQHFATEVAMDIRKCLPKSFILRLPRGSELLQTTHVVLLAGSLISDESQHNVSKAPNDLVAKHVDEIIGPYVLPWLWDARLIPDVSRQGLVVTGKLWYAGVDGATVAVCCHHNGSLPEAIETLNN